MQDHCASSMIMSNRLTAHAASTGIGCRRHRKTWRFKRCLRSTRRNRRADRRRVAVTRLETARASVDDRHRVRDGAFARQLTTAATPPRFSRCLTAHRETTRWAERPRSEAWQASGRSGARSASQVRRPGQIVLAYSSKDWFAAKTDWVASSSRSFACCH